MSTTISTKNNSKATKPTKPTNDDKIDALWVMSYASVVKDYLTKSIVGYNCYCNTCKQQSSSGNGGIAFHTAEDLLEHRNMNAFLCPCNCRFHVCEQRSSILNHLHEFHPEVITKLEKEGLDPKKSWVYPDSANNTYTLKKPMPDFEDKSPLEQGAVILSLTPPKRVYVPPSPVPSSPVPSESPVPFKKETKFAPITTKTWDTISKPKIASLLDVTKEQEAEKAKKKADILIEDDTENYEECIHYAQEDMRKEKQCRYGTHCTKKDRPFACAFNHDGLGDVIKKGTVLTDAIICPDERPPFIRCDSTFCTKIHLEHRVDYIEKMKKAHYESKVQVNNTEIDSHVASINENGIDFVLVKKNAIGISKALHEVEPEHWVKVNSKHVIKQVFTSDENTDSDLISDSINLTNIFSHLNIDA
jgi:hypothetical protein